MLNGFLIKRENRILHGSRRQAHCSSASLQASVVARFHFAGACSACRMGRGEHAQGWHRDDPQRRGRVWLACVQAVNGRNPRFGPRSGHHVRMAKRRRQERSLPANSDRSGSAASGRDHCRPKSSLDSVNTFALITPFSARVTNP